MSIKGFIVNGSTQKYDYNELDNKPTIPSGSGVSDDLKEALLQLAEKIAYVDANGQNYYQDLYDALYGSATLSYITAVYTQSGTVYTTDSLNSLKPDLVVTAHYSDSTTSTVTNYTLSGTLTAGTSVITVTYQGKTTTFNVTVTAAPSTYTITNNLTSVTNSNNATTITEGNSYSATLTAASGYTINSVQITMGGVDVTGTSYSGGTITIANVTGNIVITAVATERTATLLSIDAVFTQGSAVIYNTDTLDTLKQYLTVTANWDDSTTSTVASSDYTLSGTLTAGTSIITVSYGGKSDTFSVTVTEVPLYTFPTVTDYSSSQGTAVTSGNSVSFSSTGNSRHIYISKTRIDSYINQGPGVFFSLSANDSYSLTLKNIAYSGNSNSGNYFFVSVYGVSPYVPIETETQACANSSGTLSDVTVTGTVETAGNVIGVMVENYRDMTISFDVELRINGTRYL